MSSPIPSADPGSRPVSRPHLVPAPETEPQPWKLALALFALMLLPRLLVFPINQNLHGDAVVRTDLASRWAEAPHVITSYNDGAFQFGPLHLYAVGAALKLGIPRTDAGRWMSLLFGVLSALPLFALTRRLFDWRAGVVACAALSLWGLHIQLSTTAASEALGILIVLCLAWQLLKALQLGTFAPLAGAALFMNLAAAVRYDTWPFIPLLALLLFFHAHDRVAGATRAVLFALMSMAFPLFWMHGNEVDTGSALHPIHVIDEFHRTWAKAELAWMGQARFRAQSLFFTPGAALVTLTPLVGGFGLYGLVRACLDRPQLRWLGWWVAVPTAFYALRAAVLLSFVPLARFTVLQLVLLLPFVSYGFTSLVGDRSKGVQRVVAAAAGLLMLGFTTWLGVFTYERQGRVEDALRPVSPTSTNAPGVIAAAKRLEAELAGTDRGVILDSDPEYEDLQIAFFSLLPEERMARYRWDPERGHPRDGSSFPERLVTAKPALLLLTANGRLKSDPRFARDGEDVLFDGKRFTRLAQLEGGFSVYRLR